MAWNRPEVAGKSSVWLESWAFCQVCIGLPFEAFRSPAVADRAGDETGVPIRSPGGASERPLESAAAGGRPAYAARDALA